MHSSTHTLESVDDLGRDVQCQHGGVHEVHHCYHLLSRGFRTVCCTHCLILCWLSIRFGGTYECSMVLSDSRLHGGKHVAVDVVELGHLAGEGVNLLFVLHDAIGGRGEVG